MKYVFSLLAVSLLFAIALPGADQKQPPAKTRPFRGTIKTVNKAAQTIVLRGEKAQTFKVIPETKIRRDGKPVGFEDIAIGDTLGGFARQAPAGHWEALTLNLGQKAPEAAGSASPGRGLGGRRGGRKLQAPSSKLQINPKLQIPNRVAVAGLNDPRARDSDERSHKPRRNWKFDDHFVPFTARAGGRSVDCPRVSW